MSDEIPADLVAPAPDLILVEHYTVETLGAIRVGSAEPMEVLLTFEFEGRLNHSDERRTARVALRPRDVAELMQLITDSYSRAANRQRGGGAFGERL